MKLGAEILHLVIRLGARQRAVERRPQRNLAEQPAEMAVHLVLAQRRVVDRFLSRMRAARQPFRVHAQRLARRLHEHAVGRVGPLAVDAFLPRHRELVRRIAVRAMTDIERHRERIERVEQRGERRVVELRERAALRGRAQPARLLRSRFVRDLVELGRQRRGCGRGRAGGSGGRFLRVRRCQRQHACDGGGRMRGAAHRSWVHPRRLRGRAIVQRCFAASSFASSSSRSARRRILPTLVCGSASRNSTDFGIL